MKKEADFVPNYKEEVTGQGVPAYMTMDPTLATTINRGERGLTLPERGRLRMPINRIFSEMSGDKSCPKQTQ